MSGLSRVQVLVIAAFVAAAALFAAFLGWIFGGLR